jgi:hypothetical protein
MAVIGARTAYQDLSATDQLYVRTINDLSVIVTVTFDRLALAAKVVGRRTLPGGLPGACFRDSFSGVPIDLQVTLAGYDPWGEEAPSWRS